MNEEPRDERGERKGRIGDGSPGNPRHTTEHDEKDRQEGEWLNDSPRDPERGLLVLQPCIALSEGPDHFTEGPQFAQPLDKRRARTGLNDKLCHDADHLIESPCAPE